MEILEDDCHIKVFDAESYSLEMHCFDVLEVNYEEWEFGDSDQAVFCRSNLDNGLQRAALEVKVLVRNIELDWVIGLV